MLSEATNKTVGFLMESDGGSARRLERSAEGGRARQTRHRDE